MAKRRNPDTSTAAYKSVSVEMLNTHHSQIIKALKSLGSGIYEEIADYLGWKDKNRASRRLLEMEKLEIVWKPGAKKPTKSGRSAYVYQLRGDTQPKTDAEFNQFKKNEKASTDYAKELINKKVARETSPTYTQPKLL